MRSKLFKCSDCEKKPHCKPAKWHWEEDRRVIDKDGTLCILLPKQPLEMHSHKPTQ